MTWTRVILGLALGSLGLALTVAAALSPTPVPLTIRDSDGNLVDTASIKSGSQLELSYTYHNPESFERDLLILFEIRDSSGVSIQIAWQRGSVATASDKEVGISWIAPGGGDYQIRVFVISNLTNPEVLTGVTTTNITVIEGGDGILRREIAVYALLASDPRLAKYREGVYGHAEDFTPLRREASGAWIDEAVMHVIKQQIVEGDWRTGYSIKLSGLTDVKMEIKSTKEILSIEEVPLPDRTHEYTFNEPDKDVIQAVLDNASVRQTLESKEELGYSTFVTTVAYNGFFANSETLCPPGKCGRVHFQVENTKQVMIAWLNTDTRIVGRIDLSVEWREDCRQFACKES